MSWRTGDMNQRTTSRPRSTGEVAEQTIDGTGEPTVDVRSKTDSRPWYKKPSPWWILVTMPLSALALSGSGPSLLQIYIELVCKSQHPDHLDDGSFSFSSNAMNFSAVHHSDYHHAMTAFDPTECGKDPKVQQTVSLLVGVLLTTQGVLSILTGASWASLSDRVGRRAVLAISTAAMLFCYGYYLFVFFATKKTGNAFWSLIVGPLVAGIFGGTAVGQAASNAYIADCTESTSRARVFSLALGVRFIGMAIGPTLCSVLVKATGTPVTAIVLVVVVHIFNLAFIFFVMPESLSEARRTENKHLGGGAAHEWPSSQPTIRSRVKKIFSFLEPLAIVGPIATTTASGRAHKDYSLSFIAVSTCIASIILASNQTLFLFAFHTYQWTAVRVGYWNSGMVAARAATLLVFIPAIIRAYHYYTASRKAKSSDTDADEVTPLINSGSQQTPPTTSLSPTTVAVPPHSPFFDLAIAQGSLILECICYLVLPLVVSPSQPSVFIALTILASCGSGFGPAIQALSVELFTRNGGKEIGRLFGVFSVLQITSSQILGPLLYGVAYTRLVASYPQGIFFVSFGASVLSTTALFFVELPHGKGYRQTEDTRPV